MEQAALKKKLHYEPLTGIFTWNDTNKRAGNQHHSGYRRIRFMDKEVREHKLAWLYMTGHMPTSKEEIDHNNHIRNDNRWTNLNLGTKQDNQKNASKRKDNTSGCTGVSWNKQKQAWRAYINTGEEIAHLGCRTEWWDAVCLRKSAETKYGYHNNHGNNAPTGAGEIRKLD